jgi:lysophospholipase L1-like esterase
MSTSELQAVFTPLPASSASTKPLYVVIGDSFASGEGESSDTFYMPGTNTATNKCHVSLRSYAYLVYDKNVTDALNMACSGSRIEEVLGQSEVLEKSDSRSLLQTLSIGVGGNSVNLMDKLKTCVSVSTCEWALPDKRSETANEIQGLYPNIVSFLTTMKQTYGGVNVFFVGYPKVINDDISAQCGVVLSALLNETERRYMNETVHYLNSILAAAAQYVGIPFIDVENVFEGSRLCDPSQAAMNGIRVGDDMPLVSALGELKLIGAESFHPTPAGHALLAARIRDSVSSIDFSAPCTSCGVAQNLSPPEYWQQQPPPVNSVRLMASRFLKETVLLKRTMIEFTFPALSFAPNAVVHLELHSETQQLGTFTADTTGALQGTFDVAADASGYHTIHAFGESASGQAIDRYEIAYIGDTESTSEAVISSGSGSLQVEDVKKSPPIYLDAPSLKATRRPEVLGATTPDAASQTQQVLVRHVQDRALSNWLFMWGIWSGLCFITALLAYSIGRRQV